MGVNVIKNRDHVEAGWDATVVAGVEIGFRKRFSTTIDP